jgi:hypothetical protein
MAPQGQQNAASGYLDALSRYEMMVNEALRYLNQPVGQSTPVQGLSTGAGVPTPQELMRQTAPMPMAKPVVPSVPSPSVIAQRIAASPPVNPLVQMQGGIVNTQSGHAVPMPRPKPTDTVLTPAEEDAFQQWKAKYAPRDSGEDYDLRGAFKAGLTPGPNGHWPDTFKKPNHPTFSNESKYRDLAPNKAGSWQGETFVPPEVSRAHAKLKKTEAKRSSRFDRGKYIPPEDLPYKQGGDADAAKALRQKMSIEGMFR